MLSDSKNVVFNNTRLGWHFYILLETIIMSFMYVCM